MIIAAQEEDLYAIMEIYNREIAENTSVYQSTPYSSESIHEWYRQKREGNWPIYVWKEPAIIAGFATYGPFRRRALYATTVEHSVFVRPGFQRQGIARYLMERLMVDAKDSGIHAMVGGVDATNLDSIAFHERMGFNEVGHIPEVARKFGRWLDLKLFQLMLEEVEQLPD